MIPVRCHQAAEDELLHEIGYLELQAPGLGRRFFGEIQRAENLIAQFPESVPEVKPGIRKRVLRKFRFSLIYSLEKNHALILAVAHHSRRPDFGSVAQVGTSSPALLSPFRFRRISFFSGGLRRANRPPDRGKPGRVFRGKSPGGWFFWLNRPAASADSIPRKQQPA